MKEKAKTEDETLPLIYNHILNRKGSFNPF